MNLVVSVYQNSYMCIRNSSAQARFDLRGSRTYADSHADAFVVN